MDNPSSSSLPLLLPPPNPNPNPPPPQPPSPSSSPSPSPSPSPTNSSNPPSPDVKLSKLDLIPTSTSTPTPTPNSNPSPNPNPNPSIASSPAKKTPPLPWTHQETISLIQTYQDKWYSLKKGQLKASQWEEVSSTVAARCGFDVPSKSATQCRHKIEKLRKRYRAERLKPYPNVWQYFELMDRMERGPLPIAAHPPAAAAAVKYQKNANSVGAANFNDSDSDEGGIDYYGGSGGGAEIKKNKLKSINNIVRGGDIGVSSGNSNRNVSRMVGLNRNYGVAESGRVLKGLRTPMNQKRKGYFQNHESDEEVEEEEEEDVEEELEEEEEKEMAVGRELAAEIRSFAERFMRMENKKIEMMRETERYRMEMEKKRMDMILEAQRKVVDTIGRAFGAHKKVKMAQEI
ncbi:hypothetical protein ACH5RR_010431 [Cinchona calisaya]|uniref:Myb-like domain-containing protein n=1 Tax=Cinchona calisaya TaxID=153742 RepID=A0ABD3AIX6_9GENT